MTVLEIIQRSTEFLAQKGVESPRLQIELLLAHVLEMPRLKLYLNFQREVSEPEMERLREMVKRRARREPLQYITGSTSFCGFEMRCTPAALVPRPETELLAERAWQFLSKLPGTPRSLDIGTGTGCIAIAAAVNAPASRWVAVDLSADALALARDNAARHKVADRIEFVHGDALHVSPSPLNGERAGVRGDSTDQPSSPAPAPEPIPTPFDLIVSNPPYIPTPEIAGLDPEVRAFEPMLALDGGADGLDVFRRIASVTRAWLHPHGKIMLEFSDGQADALKSLFESEKWVVEEIVADYTGRLRILIAH